jgi:two-component sensor histidine kinase
VAHELVSNAVKHGDPPVALRLALHGSAVGITVSDASPLPARRLPYRSGVSERGLGLRLVTQLSREWGQRPDADGKSVWARVGVRPRRASA